MSAGAETALLSRWRVGGQSALDLVREFAQELPHTSAADAWQRSVQLLGESPIDPANEIRVKVGKNPVEIKGSHPFFWAGYLVVDSGWRPEAAAEEGLVAAPEPGADPAAPAPAAAPADAPAVGALPADDARRAGPADATPAAEEKPQRGGRKQPPPVPTPPQGAAATPPPKAASKQQ
jgi:hypothetical protein